MGKYLVEFGFGENFTSVCEWQTIDGLDVMDAENSEEAAKNASYTDGLEDALFRVYELVLDEFGRLEHPGEPEYFSFN